MNANDLKPLLSVSQAAELLGIREQTVRKWLSVGRLAYVKVGRRTLLEQSAVSQLIEDGRRQALSA